VHSVTREAQAFINADISVKINDSQRQTQCDAERAGTQQTELKKRDPRFRLSAERWAISANMRIV
jgi:hypothetical protein